MSVARTGTHDSGGGILLGHRDGSGSYRSTGRKSARNILPNGYRGIRKSGNTYVQGTTVMRNGYGLTESSYALINLPHVGIDERSEKEKRYEKKIPHED